MSQIGPAVMADELVVRPLRHAVSGPSSKDGPLDRLLNLALCLALIALFGPFLLALAMSVRLQDGGPAFYGQLRRGRDGRPFRCWKFRTMVTDADARLEAHLRSNPDAREEWRRDHKLRDDPRITPIGRVLRRSSLDELPQLFNVLRGEMNLVGPRPITDAEIARYGARYKHYCSIRPGITGLWQVSGRNNVSYRRRVALDVIYAQSRSLTLDVQILFMTIPAVLMRRGSY